MQFLIFFQQNFKQKNGQKSCQYTEFSGKCVQTLKKVFCFVEELFHFVFDTQGQNSGQTSFFSVHIRAGGGRLHSV